MYYPNNATDAKISGLYLSIAISNCSSITHRAYNTQSSIEKKVLK